jgi:SAM-dependent methyltransferase
MKAEGKRLENENPWQYYLRRSQEVAYWFDNPLILKTDASNEAGDLPVKGGIAGNLAGQVTCIEYDDEVVARAREKNPNILIDKGDVRNILAPPETFDIVLDLSTIDHIHPADVPKVLDQYQRILKMRGVLLIVSWITGNEKHKEEWGRAEKWSPKSQYRFMENDFTNWLAERFTIVEKDRFFTESDIFLVCYICLKTKRKVV